MKNNKEKLYWPPAVTVDVVIFAIEDGNLKVLLIRRPQAPFKNRWALPGGFLLKSEVSYKAALRILKEKTGFKNIYLEQLYTFDGPRRDPRGHILTVTHFALIPRQKINLNPAVKTQFPTFCPVKKMPKLAFDHNKIINYAIKRSRAKLEYTNAVLSLLPRHFTFNQLQKTYEIILDKKLDKRNFRKKFLSLGLIKPTNKKLKGIQHRPAQLYQFISRKSTELKKFF